MDPHMTREDAAVCLADGPHRRLYQSLTPPQPQPVKKKKLVNFKLSRKGRLGSDSKDDDRGSSTRERRGTFRSSDKRRGTLKNIDERREAFASFSDSTDIRFFDARDIISFDEMREDVRNFNERGVQNNNEKKEDIRNLNGRRNYIEHYSEQRGNTRNDNDRRQEFNNDNEFKVLESMSRRREDIRNDNRRQEGIRSLDDPGNFRNARQKREAFKNIKERRDDLKNIRKGRENLKSAKEKSETAVNMNDKSESASNIHETSEDSRNVNKIKTVRSVSSTSPDTKSYNAPNNLLKPEFPGSILNHRERSASSNSRATSEHIPLTTMRRKYTSSWEKLRMVAGSNGKGERLNSVVEIVTLKKRKGALAPTIWTPAIPRSVPSPRPANFQNHEEPGKRSYVIAFISKATQSRLRILRRQFTLPFKQPQRHHEWEARGKMYVNWLKGVVSNPHLQDGLIMKGLEIGVPYPVLYMRERLPDALKEGDGITRTLEGSLAADYVIHQGVYQEVVSWVPELLVTCPSDPSQWARCYIIVGFKTLDGELNTKMETLWKEWTGALYIYCNIDDDLGLKRLSFYRRSSRHHATLFSYLLLVELDTVTRENSLFLLDFTYRMRMRNMTGYISVYQEHLPDGAVDVVPGGSPVPSTAQATAAASGVLLETNALDLTRINI
ncbi:uncharacterized protein [Procambarus clarkii]|uniref:uncharacterized protein isoform X2 n=1 Tax=Procambarus clarkii TaxID=6728 RepID=UPI001E676F25|nr:uncharacterized protein LOC123762741 isoform X2 [Procambarus clarkii]